MIYLMILILKKIFFAEIFPGLHNSERSDCPDVLSEEVKPILRSDGKELVWRHREEKRKLDVKKISETFVKNTISLLWIRVL